MALNVAVLGAEVEWLRRMESDAAAHDLTLESFDDAGILCDMLGERTREIDLVVLGAGVRDPIRIAQRIHGLDGELDVLIDCEAERRSQCKQVLSISPFVGNQVRCRPETEDRSTAAELAVGAGRTRARRRHHAWLAAARRSLATEDAPVRSVQVLDRLLDQVPIGVMLVHLDGRIIACNRMVERTLELSEAELLGKDVDEIFSGPRRRKVVDFLAESTQAAAGPVTWETIEIEKSAGTSRHLRINGSVVTARGGRRAILVVLDDVTEARRREAALRESQQDLQRLAGKLVTAHEDERMRLARELHDDLTQRLAMLALDISRLGLATGQPAQFREEVDRLGERMTGLSTDVHKMSRQLHPTVLTDLGLAAAIDSECSRLSDLEGLQIAFDAIEVPDHLPNDVALCLYRILQEALRNIVKHSRTKRARVSLSGDVDQLHLSIRDEGVGFDVDLARRQAGIGLASMEERVRLIHGSLTVQSAPSHGTTIDVLAPLRAT